MKAIRAHSTSDLPTHTQTHTLLLKKGGEVRGFGHKKNIRGKITQCNRKIVLSMEIKTGYTSLSVSCKHTIVVSLS